MANASIFIFINMCVRMVSFINITHMHLFENPLSYISDHSKI